MSSPDRLEVDTVAMETAGLQLAGIRSESTTASELANAIIGSVAPPDAGLGIGDAVSAMGRAWAEGFVVREPDRRYHLGPALVRPGRVAEQRYGTLATARAGMVALTERVWRSRA